MASPPIPVPDGVSASEADSFALSDDSAHGNAPILNGVNGHHSNRVHQEAADASDSTEEEEEADDEPELLDTVGKLQQELERTRAEKDALAEQYHSLLGKLTTMRTTLGNKLREDAEELDRREQLTQQLTAQNEAYVQSIETLQHELVSSSNESEKLTAELSMMRSKAVEESAFEMSMRERQVMDLQNELEACRTERSDWERAAQEERVAADEARTTVETLRRELEAMELDRQEDAKELQSEKDKSTNLQSVLEDFQSVKELELRHALTDYDIQIRQTTQSLAEYKARALTAEADLSEVGANGERLTSLEQELKDKTQLIGKLRHESVITNEHLTEAMRRLRKNASSENVDRRLITNILLSYLTTARGDSKRYEMLSLMASILSWTDPEREIAGLQRAGAAGGTGGRQSAASGRPASGQGKVEETESFSNMFVEFLLKESAQGQAEASPLSTTPSRQRSLPGSTPPSSPGGPRSSQASSQGTPRPSMSLANSRPSLSATPTLGPPPARKRDQG